MSIETLLSDLTAAIRENTAALTGTQGSGKGTKGKAKATEAEQPAPTPTTQAPATTAGTANATPAVASPELMKALQEAVTKLANTEGKGRDAIVAALKQFGATKIPEVVAAGKADAFLAYIKAQSEPVGTADFM